MLLGCPVFLPPGRTATLPATVCLFNVSPSPTGPTSHDHGSIPTPSLTSSTSGHSINSRCPNWVVASPPRPGSCQMGWTLQLRHGQLALRPTPDAVELSQNPPPGRCAARSALNPPRSLAKGPLAAPHKCLPVVWNSSQKANLPPRAPAPAGQGTLSKTLGLQGGWLCTVTPAGERWFCGPGRRDTRPTHLLTSSFM